MPCRCATSTLAIFVRRVAQIDLESTVLQTSRYNPFSVAKRNVNDFSRVEFPQTARSGIIHQATYPDIPSNDSMSSDQLPLRGKPLSKKPRTWPTHLTSSEGLDENSWKMRDLGQEPAFPTAKLYSETVSLTSFRDRVQSITANAEAPPAVLELTPEVIDQLAAESLGHSPSAIVPTNDSFYETNLRLAKTRPKGFLEHHISQPAPSIAERKGPENETGSVSNSSSSTATDRQNDRLITERRPWQIQKAALKEKFKDGWNPRKKLSPDALAGIRAIHAQFPEQYTTSVLAEKFEVSPEAIRRILKSHWTPKEEEELDRQRRWFSRGKKVWSRYAELGVKPPARWRKLGIGKRDASEVDRHYLRSNERTTLGIQDAERTSQDSYERFRPGGLAERIL